MKSRLTVSNALQVLAGHDQPFTEMFAHGSLNIEFYQPDSIDLQQPHSRDEIYVVVAGSGDFICGPNRQAFEVGEVLFAGAGIEHRFENFTDDFATWVFFYGPEGGEQGSEEAGEEGGEEGEDESREHSE